MADILTKKGCASQAARQHLLGIKMKTKLFDPPSSACRHLLPPAGEGSYTQATVFLWREKSTFGFARDPSPAGGRRCRQADEGGSMQYPHQITT
jgi:hypothetical protein